MDWIMYQFFMNGPATYQWEHNGEPILGGTQSSLTIENATSKDSGLYRVTITKQTRQLHQR